MKKLTIFFLIFQKYIFFLNLKNKKLLSFFKSKCVVPKILKIREK